MTTPTLELQTSAVLEREIQEIEARAHDDRIRSTVAERMAIANDPETVFIPHSEVFSASRARLIAKLANKGNA